MTPRRALRVRWWAAASCLLAIAAGASVRTSAAARDPQLEAGIRQVQEGELSTALVTLDEAVQHLLQPGASVHELALAHVCSGIARLGMGSPLGRRGRACGAPSRPIPRSRSARASSSRPTFV